MGDFAIGWVAGALGIAATHPLDTTRVRMQHLAKTGGGNSSVTAVVRSIYRHGGASAFFRGIIPPVVNRGISFAVIQATMNEANRHTPSSWDAYPIMKATVTGALGANVAAVVENPMYVIK